MTTLNRAAYQRLIDEDLAWLESVPRTLERDHVIAIVRASLNHEYPRACAEARPSTEKIEDDALSRSETPEISQPLRSSAATDGGVTAPAPNEDAARFHERIDREITALEAISDLPPSLVTAVRAARRLMRLGPTRDYDMPEPVDAYGAAMIVLSLQHFLTERTMHAAWRKRAEEAEALHSIKTPQRWQIACPTCHQANQPIVCSWCNGTGLIAIYLAKDIDLPAPRAEALAPHPHKGQEPEDAPRVEGVPGVGHGDLPREDRNKL